MTYQLDAPVDTPWPPLDARPALRDMREWAAYWTNRDSDLLQPGPGDDAGSSTWWGKWIARRRTSSPQTTRARNIVTVPIAGDIAMTSADLLFGDVAPLSAGEDASPDLTARLEELATRITLDLHAAADMSAGLGGVWLVPRWDTTITDRCVVQPVGQDQVFAEWRSGMMVAATIVETLPPLSEGDQDVWRHFERHETGIVHHQLRRGTTDQIGRPVPVTEHPATKYLADLINTDGTGISLAPMLAVGAPAGIMPTFVPNSFNRASRSREWGAADIAKSSTLRMIDMLNETYSSWGREIRVGQARILIARSLLDDNNRLDLDDEVFSPVELDEAKTSEPIKPVEFQLRTEKFQATAQHLTEQIVSAAGYAPQTFGIHTEGAISGTAHRLRELRTHRTTGKKQSAWSPAYPRLARWMLAVDRAVYGMQGADQPETLSVVWPETDTDEPKERAETIRMLGEARAMSMRTRVQLAQPDLTPEQVDEEVQRIRAEAGEQPDLANDFPPVSDDDR